MLTLFANDRRQVRLAAALVVILFAAMSLPVLGQSQISAVPRLVKYSGVVKDAQGSPHSGTVGVTFALYKDEQGGAALWLETQNVQADAQGHYSVYLGATKSGGLPQDVFASGEARWLGVQPEGQAEQPRTLLLSVPYALKAGDAETVGGLPASAFVLAAAGNPASGNGVAELPAITETAVVSGSGTTNFVPLWATSTSLGNSVLFQSGSGNTAKLGVNTTTPAATLDVNGNVVSRGTLQLPSKGTATAGGGFNSQPFSLQGSAFNSGTQQAIGPLFQWQTEPSGNNTSNPAGTLNLLYGNGSGSPSETGLNIANNGRITFAAGQAFPGTGTITGVMAGTDLKGGGTSGSVTLNVDTTKVVTGVLAGTDLTGGGTGGVQTLNLDIAKVPQLNAANSFNGNQNITGNLTASGTVTGGDLNAANTYQLAGSTFAFGSTANRDAFLGFAGNPASPGAGNTAIGVLALASNTTGTQNTATGVTTMYYNTVGNNNVATGNFALILNQSGSGNTASGYEALQLNTTGNFNTATGIEALDSNTTGASNTAIGQFTLFSNTTGNSNTGSGDNVLYSNTTGSANTGDGNYAMYNNLTGSDNVAMGDQALLLSTTGSFNSSLGSSALLHNTTGSNNTGLGYNAGPDINSPNLNNATAIGANAQVTASNAMVLGSINGVNGATADTNVGIGTTAPAAKLDVHGSGNFTGLITFGAGQTFPGAGTISGVTAGTDLIGGGSSGNVTLSVDTTKVVTGITAGTDLTGGGTGGVPTLNLDTTKVPQLNTANTFTASQTVNANLTAAGTLTGGVVNAATSFNLSGSVFAFGSTQGQNAFLGFAGNSTSTGGFNTAVGYQALSVNTSGLATTAIGTLALAHNTVAANNTAIGFESLASNSDGFNNTASGAGALLVSDGSDNTANGAFALFDNTSGSNNTALGLDSLGLSTTGSNNTAVGSLAGIPTNSAFTTGSNDTFVGANSGPVTQTNLSNATAIGANAAVTASNALVLGSINGVNSATADTNVGIGTTAPQTLLHIDHKPPAGVGQDLLLITSGQTGDVASLLLQNTGPGLRLRVGAGTDSTYLASSGPLEFVTGDTGNPDHPAAPAIFIDATGKVGIGESGPGRILEVARGSGHAIADGWDVYSSRRWKTNIQTLPDALGKVEQLRGVSYDLKDSGKHEIGVIAEEVGKVVPELVSYEANGKDARGVDYSRLTALLIEAVKQQQKQVHNQQREIVSLRTQLRQQAAKNALLESRLEKVEKGHESTDPKLAMYQKPVTAGPLRSDHDKRQGMER